MQTLKDATEGIYPLQPYQQAVYNKAMAGGFKPGEMVLYSAGPRTGKSIFNVNLCREIMLTGQQTMTTLLTSLNIPDYPKTSASLNRLMPKYKFGRAKWYVAEFDWVHQGEVLEWCRQQFGPHPKHPDAWSRWQQKFQEQIHFRDERDYTWFMLRWS